MEKKQITIDVTGVRMMIHNSNVLNFDEPTTLEFCYDEESKLYRMITPGLCFWTPSFAEETIIKLQQLVKPGVALVLATKSIFDNNTNIATRKVVDIYSSMNEVITNIDKFDIMRNSGLLFINEFFNNADVNPIITDKFAVDGFINKIKDVISEIKNSKSLDFPPFAYDSNDKTFANWFLAVNDVHLKRVNLQILENRLESGVFKIAVETFINSIKWYNITRLEYFKYKQINFHMSPNFVRIPIYIRLDKDYFEYAKEFEVNSEMLLDSVNSWYNEEIGEHVVEGLDIDDMWNAFINRGFMDTMFQLNDSGMKLLRERIIELNDLIKQKIEKYQKPDMDFSKCTIDNIDKFLNTRKRVLSTLNRFVDITNALARLVIENCNNNFSIYTLHEAINHTDGSKTDSENIVRMLSLLFRMFERLTNKEIVDYIVDGIKTHNNEIGCYGSMMLPDQCVDVVIDAYVKAFILNK